MKFFGSRQIGPNTKLAANLTPHFLGAVANWALAKWVPFAVNLPRTRSFWAVMIFIDWPLYIAGYCLGSGLLSCNGSNHCWEKFSTPHIICCVWHWANMKVPSNITKQPNYVDCKQNIAPLQLPTNTNGRTKDKTTNTIKSSFNEGNQNLAEHQQKQYR